MIELRYGRTRASVQPMGAQLASFRAADGRERIWQADPAVWAQHTPVLFPVCGSVRDNQISIGEKLYPMNKHGFTRDVEFTVWQRGEDFADLVLFDSERTRAMYPFRFAFHVIYQLWEGGCMCTFRVENRSEQVMPFCVGGHPGFACPMEDGAVFEDYQLVFPLTEDGENTLCPGGGLASGTECLKALRDGRVLPLTHSLFDERDALIFAGLRSRSVSLVHRATGRGLRFDFPRMEVLAVWTKPHAEADYLCLEPWHGMPAGVQESGRFEDKPFVTLLQPGCAHTCWYSFTLCGDP